MANTTDLRKMFEKGKRNIRRVSPKASSWGANMLKSLGYSAMEVFEGLTPNMANITQNSIEGVKHLKETLAESKGQTTSLKDAVEQNVYVGIGKDWFQNALDDLKSGKLYNRDRYMQSVDDSFNDIDIGFDDDFDMGEDFDESFDDTITSDDEGATASFHTKSKNGDTVTQVVMSNNIGPDSAIVQATENQSEIIVKASDIATKTSIAGTQAIIQMTSRLGTDVTSLLSTINESITDINSSSTKILSGHSAASLQYYSDSMETQKGILTEIKALRETMTAQVATTSTLGPAKESVDILNMFSGGVMDTGEYIKYLKKNALGMLQTNLFTSQVMGMASDTDTLKAYAANPLSFIPAAIIKNIIPSVTRAAIDKLDKTVGEFAVGALTKLGSKRNDYDDPIGQFFGKLFGIQNEMRTRINKGNYEKGQVPWDGIARRTLVDVIPNYLSQIAAAVTGTEQMVFDYDQGTYKSLRSIKKDQSDLINSTKTSPFFDDIRQFNDMVNNQYTGMNQDDVQEVKDLFKKLVIANVDRGGGINYRIGKDGKDELAETLQRYTGDPMLAIIRSFFEGRHQAGDNAANIRFFGRSAQEARINVSRLTESIERDPIYNNMQYLDNGLDNFDNTHLKFYKNGTHALRGTGGPNADKYGKRPAEYLRDILIRLNKGILVEVTNMIGGTRFDDQPIDPDKQSDIVTSSRVSLDAMKTDQLRIDDIERSNDAMITRTNTGYQDDINRGKIDINDAESAISSSMAQEYHKERLDEGDKEAHGVNKRSILSKLADRLPPGMRKAVLAVDAQIGKYGEKAANGFGKVNDYLYSLLFGKDNDTSILKDFINRMKNLFGNMKGFLMDKVLKPVDDALFGKDGFFTKIKESEMVKDFKDAFGRVKENIFGVKTTDADGKVTYEGGILSDTMTELRSMGSNVKIAIFGDKNTPLDKDTSVFGSIKKMGKQVGDSISRAVGLKSDSVDKPLSSRIVDKMDDVWLGVQDRFSEWSDMILGPKVDDKGKSSLIRQGLDSFGKDMKGKGGAIGAGAVVGGIGAGLLGSHVGLLSSIFLPGGPIGGALLGAGITIVNKSETLKSFLFGPEEDGERTGGLITKEIVDFVSSNKKGLIGGAFAGLAASMGLIPSFFVPGGPIGGAIIGGALSMATKTEVFQEFLYGEGGTKDDPTGGLMKKFKDIFGKNKDLKGLALNVGIGAGVGLIGSFFLPGGPIVGSLIGAAASVAMNTERFKTFMFGEERFDENGKSLGRKGGLFGQVTNFVSTQIFKPLANTARVAQIKMIGFVERDMIAPLLSALSPITNKLEEIGLNLRDGFKGFFKSIGDRFHETITKPIGDAIQPYVDKMKSVLSKIFGGLFKAVGAVISSPFKLIGAVGKGIFEGDKRRGEKAEVSDEISKIFDFKGRRERGERMGLFGTTVDELDENGNPTGNRTKVGRGLLGQLIYANSKEVKERGAYSERGAGRYATAEKNPYTIEQDFIAKSKAREAERLAKLNRGSGSGSPMDRFRAWLDKQNPVQDSKVINTGEFAPGEFKVLYDSYKSAGLSDADLLAELGIETNDPEGTIKRLLRGKKVKDKSSGRSKRSKKESVDTSSISVSSDSPATEISVTKVADVITAQTDIETEHHKETIGLFEGIRDRIDTLLDKLDIDRPKVPEINAGVDINSDISTPKTAPVTEIDIDGDVGIGRSKSSLLSKISTEVDRISNSVYGQLNGVGSNINKIYRLLLKITGHSDDDIKGDNNKEYVGFFGKIRTMLNNPIKMVTNILMSPIRLLGKGVEKIHSAFTSVVNVFKEGAKSIWEGTKALASGIGQAALSILQLPIEGLKLLGTVLKNALPVLKETLVGGIKVGTTAIVEGLKIGGTVVVESIRTIGSAFQGAAQGFGELLGGAMSGLGSLLSGLGLIGKETIKGVIAAGKGVFKFGAGLVSGALRTGSTVVGNILGGIFGKKGDGMFPSTMDVYVVGGTLDEVTFVEEVDPDYHKEFKKSLDIQLTRISESIDKIINPASRGSSGDSGEPPVIPIENASSHIAANMGMPGFGASMGFSAQYAGFGNDSVVTGFPWLDKMFNRMIGIHDEEEAKNKEKEEYETRVKAGSSEDHRRASAEEDEKEAAMARHEGMMQKLSEIAGINREHHTGWSGVFGLKKGLITLALLAAVPMIIKSWPAIKQGIANIIPTIKQLIDVITPIVKSIADGIGNILSILPGSIKDSGGVPGILNNASELFDNKQQLFTGKKMRTKINDDGTAAVITDADGNVIDVEKETVDTGGIIGPGRMFNYIMPERTKVDTETGEVYHERALTSASEAGIKGMFMRSKFFKPLKNAVGENLADGWKSLGSKAKSGMSTLASKVVQNSEFLQNTIQSGRALASKAVSAGKGFIDDAILAGKTTVSGFATKAVNTGKSFADDAASKLAKMFSRNPDDAIKTATKITDGSGLIKNFIQTAKEAIVKLADDVVGFLASKGIVGESALKVASTIKGYVSKITEKACKPFIDKIKGWFTKAAASTSTAFLAELGFGAIGAIVANPAQVFGVNKKDVDLTMQAIARFMRGLLSTSFGSIVDIINQIVYYVFGVDVVGEVCVQMYNALASDVDREKLKKARESFMDDYTDFSNKEYDAYVRKAQESGQAVMTREQFQASDLATSRSQYNEQKNPDLIQRGLNTASRGFNWVKRGVGKLFGGKGDEVGGFGEGDEGDTKTKPAPTELNGMPYFSQNDPNYKNLPYNLSDGSEDTIASRGCGPTAMAMIGKAYGANTDPASMANMATRGGYSTEVGTVPKFFSDVSSRMGLSSEQLAPDQMNVSTALAGGTPILLQGQDEDPTSPYTGKGHYVVGTRLASGNGVAINDPRGPEFSGVYPMNKVLKGAKNMWVFNNGQSIPSMEETGGFGVGNIIQSGAKNLATTLSSAVTAEKVIKIAANEVGYIEKKSNSQLDDKAANPGDKNYTKYNKCVGSNPQYWCAAFVCWCFEQAAGGDKDKLHQLLCGGKSAACNTLMDQFKRAGRFDKTPKLGDCIFFSGSRHGGANHIAIVVGVDNAKVYTIEGNTSGSAGVVDNGGEVAFKQYELGAGRILGYGHPVFDAETNFGGIIGEGQLAASASGGGTSVVSTDGSSGSSSGTGFLGVLSNLATGIGNIFMKAFGFNVDEPSTTTTSGYSSDGSSYAVANGDAPLTGNSVEEQTWNYFTNKGFTKEATAGIMGNIWQESKFKPDMIQKGSGHAAGLFQWESYKNKSKRWANLDALAKSRGKSWTDLGTQLDFGLSEMQNDSWMWKTAETGYNTGINSFDQFTKLNNVGQATEAFNGHFERCKIKNANLPERKAMAQKYYDTYKNMVPGAQAGTTNNAAINAGMNMATLQAEGGAKSTALAKPSVLSSIAKTGLSNIQAKGGLGGFGGDDESTKLLGAKLGLIPSGAEREMYSAPIRAKDSYGGFGSVPGDNNEKVVELLGTIATETGGINSGVRTLNDKELPSTGNVQNVYNLRGGTTNVTNHPTTPSKGIPFEDDMESVGNDYAMAKKMARSMISS